MAAHVVVHLRDEFEISGEASVEHRVVRVCKTASDAQRVAEDYRRNHPKTASVDMVCIWVIQEINLPIQEEAHSRAPPK